MRGQDHFTTALETKATVEAVTRDDLVAFHKRYVHPGNFIVPVSGDFKTADMKARLEKAMAGWPPGSVATAVPKPGHQPLLRCC